VYVDRDRIAPQGAQMSADADAAMSRQTLTFADER
jgi:hypothetical protein